MGNILKQTGKYGPGERPLSAEERAETEAEPTEINHGGQKKPDHYYVTSSQREKATKG